MSPLLAVAVLLSRPALAGDNSDQNCGVDRILPSGSRRVMRQAAEDNSALYGAVGVAERKVLPMLHEHEDMGMFVYEHHVLLGATHVPAVAAGSCEDSYLHSPVDLASGSIAFAFSRGDLGAYYVASVTIAEAYGSGPTRFLLNYAVPFTSAFYGLAAPFLKNSSEVGGSGAYGVDYVAGAEYTPGTFAFRAAYIGSQGAYLQAAESRSGAFVGVAANEAFARLPYLRGGLQRLALPQKGDRLGVSSLFARKMELPALSSEPAAQDDRDFWSGHLAQEGMLGWLDLVGAYAVRPTPFLHELRVGAHSEDYLELKKNREGWGWGGLVGVASVPPATDLGVEGGTLPSASLQAVYGVDGRRSYFRWDISLRYNDPEVLARFPYAENALDIYVGFEGGG